MNTRRTSFEDRLLKELQREIELRESVSTEAETSEGGATTSVRRLLTPRRISLAAAVCAVAGLAAVVVPGSPTDSVAYAVESHGDGSVTLTLQGGIDLDAQYDLARELRPNGIVVDVELLPPGYTCKPWGKAAALRLVSVGKDDIVSAPVHSWTVPVRVTLSRGNVLVFENSEGSAEPQAVHAYEIDRYTLDSSTTETESEPCVPVKPTP
ncbi:hypothetical protein [Streptomyces sp. GQFP]|uniref:hypothetical protein n=1 Tax=Streptomyces sp. GQFP TaxID=2907545 RepID=UPI001F4718E5|nr:hypothetical protein [Streptomyces sp. GQFP]UIX31676.1 hypothetical protein LUX31_17430 [Streptomyces sp. GQFP]